MEIDQAGIPQYEIKENVAWDNIPYTARLENLAQRTRAVCFGSLAQRSVVSRTTINRFLPHDNDPLVVFDVNLRQGFYNKDILCNSMKRCNILKINDEELVTVSRMFGYPGIDLQDKCWILLGKYNLKMLILTCGINGSYVFTPGNVPSDTAGGSGRHRRCRRLVHSGLHLLHSKGENSAGSSQTRCRNIRIRVYTTRCDATAPGRAHTITANTEAVN